MYVLSIKVPIRKKSGNLFNDPRLSSLVIDTVIQVHEQDCILNGVNTLEKPVNPTIVPQATGKLYNLSWRIQIN